MAYPDKMCEDWVEEVQRWQNQDNKLSRISSQLEKRSNLLTFLSLLQKNLHKCHNADHALRVLPGVGQILGRLCSLPTVLALPDIYAILMECVLWFYRTKSDDSTSLELKAKSWALTQVRSTVCHMNQKLPSLPLEEFGFTQFDHNKAVIEQVVRNMKSARLIHSPLLDEHTSDEVTFLPAARICLHLAHMEGMVAMLEECVLSLCCRKHDSAGVEKLLYDVMETQRSAYTGACVIELSEACLHALWGRLLPCLEQEVLSLVSAAADHPYRGMTHVQTLINSRCLAAVCAEDLSIYHAVFTMLWTLHAESPHNATLTGVLSQLHRAVRSHMMQSDARTVVSVCSMFLPSMHSLIALLIHEPLKMTLSVCSHHAKAVGQALLHTDTHTHQHVIEKIIIYFSEWNHALILILLLGNEDVLKPVCVALLELYGISHQALKTETQLSLEKFVVNLRNLLHKPTVPESDLRSALSPLESGFLSQLNSAAHAIIRDCVIVFTLVSACETSTAESLMNLVTGRVHRDSTSPTQDSFRYLIKTLDSLDILLPYYERWMEPQKLPAVFKCIKFLKEKVTVSCKGESGQIIISDIDLRVKELKKTINLCLSRLFYQVLKD